MPRIRTNTRRLLRKKILVGSENWIFECTKLGQTESRPTTVILERENINNTAVHGKGCMDPKSEQVGTIL